MRETKFRVYDTVNKCYISDTSNLWINPHFSHICEWRPELDGQTVFELNNTLVFQQYTGLKDRNGQEIYEGDIIERKRIGLRESIDTAGNVEWTKGEIIDRYEIKYVIDTLDLHGEYAELYNGFIGVHLDKDQCGGIGNEFKFENCGTAGIVTTEYEVVGNIYE